MTVVRPAKPIATTAKNSPSGIPPVVVQQDTNMENEDDDLAIDPENLNTPLASIAPTQSIPMDEDKPDFRAAKASEMGVLAKEKRIVPVPPHRFTPLKENWLKIYSPLVEHLKLMVRMNVKRKSVELMISKHTPEVGNLQKGADFVKAFALGFDVNDAVALLRMDELYIDTFEIKDVKTLHGDHLSRAIGRIAGKGGKTKFTIENASKTRIVLADTKIHILGSFQNIKVARDALVSLILGSPAGKILGNLRTVSARMKERF